MGVKSVYPASLAEDVANIATSKISISADEVLTTTDNLRVFVDSSGGAVSVTLPAGVEGQFIEVIDAAGSAGTNIITIVGAVDSGANVTIEADNGSKQVTYVSGWESSGGFQNYFKRNASTGEISTREPDTFVADELQASSGTATVSDQSVADADFDTTGSTNLDETVADEFGNSAILGAEFNDGNKNTDEDTPYVVRTSEKLSTDFLTYSGWNVFKTYVSGPQDVNSWYAPSTQDAWLSIDVSTNRTFTHYQIQGHSVQVGASPKAWDIEVSTDGGSTWDVVDSRFGQVLGADLSQAYEITTPTLASQIRIRVTETTDGLNIFMSNFLLFEAAPATTLNTFDTNLATGTAGAFSPSSFKAYDETATLISGAGKINVAYAVDGGAFSSLVDQDTFKALSDVSYTTQFDLQLQLVGTQRFSKATLSSAVVKSYVGQSGIVVEQGGLVYAELGDVFKAPQKTTAERDALTPAAGWVIYNSTTNKMNFYSGSAWEAITSA